MSHSTTHDRRQTHEFKDHMHKMGEGVDELKESLTGLAHGAASTARAGVHEAAKGVQRTLNAGKKGAADAVDGLSERISARPLVSAGVALGLGIVIGFLFRRSRG